VWVMWRPMAMPKDRANVRQRKTAGSFASR
jgi:hypothetical protein